MNKRERDYFNINLAYENWIVYEYPFCAIIEDTVINFENWQNLKDTKFKKRIFFVSWGKLK